jgi:lysozyme family protein
VIASRESFASWSRRDPRTSLGLEAAVAILSVGAGFAAYEIAAGFDFSGLPTTQGAVQSQASAQTFGLTAADFGVNWASEKRKQDAIALAKRCLQHLPEAQQMERKHGIPALLLLAKHAREASCDFTKNALNGQPLSQRTTIVPVGYGPFASWAESVDAAVSRGYYESADWSKPDEWARVAEKFNGLGYQKRGLVSPYVWAGDKRYDSQGGKFVADGVFDRNHFDQQLGVIPLVVAMLELQGATPAPVGGDIQARVLAQAIASNGRSSKSGPKNGRLACAWATFNFVLEPVFGPDLRPKMTNVSGVNALIADLQSHAGLRQATGPSKGAIVVHGLASTPGGANQHIGVCADDRCSTSWNNSSSLAKWRLSDYPKGYSNVSYWVFQ